MAFKYTEDDYNRDQKKKKKVAYNPSLDDLRNPTKYMQDEEGRDPDVMDFPSGGKTRKGSDVLDRLIELEKVKKKTKKKKTKIA